MVGYSETTVLDISALFGGSDASLDLAIAEVLGHERSFVATGYPGASGLDQRVDRLLSFFAMNQDAKLACSTCGYRASNPNMDEDEFVAPALGRNGTLRLLHTMRHFQPELRRVKTPPNNQHPSRTAAT